MAALFSANGRFGPEPARIPESGGGMREHKKTGRRSGDPSKFFR